MKCVVPVFSKNSQQQVAQLWADNHAIFSIYPHALTNQMKRAWLFQFSLRLSDGTAIPQLLLQYFPLIITNFCLHLQERRRQIHKSTNLPSVKAERQMRALLKGTKLRIHLHHILVWVEARFWGDSFNKWSYSVYSCITELNFCSQYDVFDMHESHLYSFMRFYVMLKVHNKRRGLVKKKKHQCIIFRKNLQINLRRKCEHHIKFAFYALKLQMHFVATWGDDLS